MVFFDLVKILKFKMWKGGGGDPRAMDASRLFGGWLCAPVFACVGRVFLLYFVVRGNTK